MWDVFVGVWIVLQFAFWCGFWSWLDYLLQWWSAPTLTSPTSASDVLKPYLHKKRKNTAVVTGASSVLGKWYVDLLLQANFQVVAFIRSDSDMHEEDRTRMTERGVLLQTYTDLKDVEKIWNNTLKHTLNGTRVSMITAVFHVAGHVGKDKELKQDPGALLESNVGFIICMDTYMEPYLAKGEPVLRLYVSTQLLHTTIPDHWAYATSKYALEYYVKSQMVETRQTCPLHKWALLRAGVFRSRSITIEEWENIPSLVKCTAAEVGSASLAHLPFANPIYYGHWKHVLSACWLWAFPWSALQLPVQMPSFLPTSVIYASSVATGIALFAQLTNE